MNKIFKKKIIVGVSPLLYLHSVICIQKEKLKLIN